MGVGIDNFLCFACLARRKTLSAPLIIERNVYKMKKLLSMMLIIAILAISVPCTFASDSVGEGSGQIKNIIYLIPDGGGYGLYDFANMVKVAGGFDTEKFPNKTPTDTEPMSMRAQLAGSMTTASASSSVTDSAAAGTAMSSGYKTINGYIGIDKNSVPKANLVEAAESVGKSTGIISTYHWSHATPAAFTAHAQDRGDDYNIYQQIENKDLEVVLGVGYGMVSQYATIQNAIDNGYTIVETKEDLLNVRPGDKIWGNVAEKTYPYDVELGADQPTLAEMTAGAIEALSGDPDGFFLMVEGGKVDTGGHRDDARISTSEYLAFDAAFKVALDFAKGRTDTVVIAAPDHDTGGIILPENPETAVSEVMDGINPSSVLWTSYSHTGQNVGVWIYLPEGVSSIEGLSTVLGDTQSTRENYIIDNTAIAPWCADLMGVDLAALSDELFVNVSTIGQYSALTRKFTFNNGDKYVYCNQDEYYKDGVKISTNGRTAVYLNKAFYVPAEMVDEDDWNYVSEAGSGDGITGKGTASDPYIIDDAYDFMEFTGNMLSGNSYKGKYIRQANDIDLTPFSDYHGIGDGATFSGVYDGHGNKIKVAITSDQDVSVFPKLAAIQSTNTEGTTVYNGGVLMNVGIEGTIKSTKEGGYATGLAYYVGVGGKIGNCYSNAKIQASYAAGLAVSTLVGYKPGSAGAQQTTMMLLLPGAVTVFTHHPLKDKVFHTAPGFWGGYGCAPHAVQDHNVCLLIHHIPKSITFSPAPMLPYTHTYLPEELLDEVRVEGRYAFARKGDTFIALIGASDFEYLEHNPEKAAVMEGLLKDMAEYFKKWGSVRNAAWRYNF